MSTVLQEICDVKREHIAACKQRAPLAEIEEQAKSAPAVRGFIKALQRKLPSPALIAEVKKASPSKGLIRDDFEPAEIARAYEAGGAACLSVLTDAPYFQGHNDYLVQARAACSLPVLRKDFMLDTYQVAEARAIGADCILLIMAALEDAQAQELEAAAHHYGMDALIEVHDEQELERATSKLSSPLMGINNRNLKTLDVDLNTSINLRKQLTDKYITVCESGIKTHAHITTMQSHNMHCFLVGESLMLQRNITQATKALLGNG